MAKKYLDYDGLLYFWQKIKAKFNKADIAYDTTNKKITKTIDGATSDVVTAATLKTDMGLGSVAAGAEVNQNAFSNVKVGSTTVAADTKTDTLELVAGSNVTLTPDSTNDKITIAATDTKYTAASAAPKEDGTAAVGTSAKYAREDHVHPHDSTKVDKVSGKGLSTNDFTDALETKLNGIEAGANVGFDNISFTSGDGSGVGFSANDGTSFDFLLSNDFLIGEPTNQGIPLAINNKYYYGTSNTAAGTAEKDVVCSDFTELVTGARIIVKFNTTNTAAITGLKLDVNNKGAKPIKYRGGNLPAPGTLAANRVYEFVYDGTNWDLVGDLDTNTTYTAMGAAEATTGTSTVARTITAKVLDDKIDEKIAAASVGGATFQGTISAQSTLENAAYKKGWYWVVDTAGTYAGQVCEAGDMIFAIKDKGSAYADSDFNVVQTNLDMAAITNSEIDTILAA